MLNLIFRGKGYSVDINNPYRKMIQPIEYYSGNKKIYLFGLGINRRLYLDEDTYTKNKNYDVLKNDILMFIKNFDNLEIM